MEKSIEYELLLNRISGPYKNPPYQNFKSSPLALREKKDSGKYRMLHNLSYQYNTSPLIKTLLGSLPLYLSLPLKAQ